MSVYVIQQCVNQDSIKEIYIPARPIIAKMTEERCEAILKRLDIADAVIKAVSCLTRNNMH